MKRLIQALRSKIYPGDIIIDNVRAAEWRKNIHTVEKIFEGHIVYKAGYNTELLSSVNYVTKLRLETFKNEWNKFFKTGVIHEADKLPVLEQLCLDHGVHYLYGELMQSRTSEEFKTNSDLINQMLKP